MEEVKKEADKVITTIVVDKAKTVQVETIKTQSIQPKEYGVVVKSKEVWIRHKPSTMNLPFQSADAKNLNKIGSSYSSKGQGVLRGLSYEEEIKFLPDILGMNPKSENWDKATKEYWANISKIVPPSDKDGQGGLKLEVGRKYTSKEDEDFDVVCSDESTKRGTPLSVADFVLWRYCLVYNRVAKDINDIYKSPKIEFYIYSRAEEVNAKKVNLKVQREANMLFYSKMAERGWIESVLRIFLANDKDPKIYIKDLEKVSEDEKDIELEKYVKMFPERFVAIGTDESLELRSFIELCIINNKLVRLPNTETILMGETTVGNTNSEAVAFFKNEKNHKLLQTLQSQVRLTP